MILKSMSNSDSSNSQIGRPLSRCYIKAESATDDPTINLTQDNTDLHIRDIIAKSCSGRKTLSGTASEVCFYTWSRNHKDTFYSTYDSVVCSTLDAAFDLKTTYKEGQ